MGTPHHIAAHILIHSHLWVQARGLVALKPAPRANEYQGTIPLQDDIEVREHGTHSERRTQWENSRGMGWKHG